MNEAKKELLTKLSQLEKQLELVLSSLHNKPDSSTYMTAQDIEREFGIDQRTILNRSNLHHSDKRFIPSLRMGGRRKYFERKVIARLLKPNK